jgi:glyoxylase-like metal-dependent hydrolase (beta-lactamase superfamily II)
VLRINHFEEVTQINMSRTLEGKPLYWVSSYLVDGLLIDTGCSYTANELASFLKDKNLNKVVNTHFHEDHIGANHILEKDFGVEIFAHPDSVPLINQTPHLYPYQELVWGYPVPTAVKTLPRAIRTESYTFQPIETPGHSNGHIALVEMNRGWCFSGDIFAREKPKYIRPEEDMGETIRSMQNLLVLETGRLVLFTSVGKIIKEGRRALQSCIGYLEGLSLHARGLQERGFDVDGIVDEIFGGEHGIADFTNGQFTTKNLVLSVLKIQKNRHTG